MSLTTLLWLIGMPMDIAGWALAQGYADARFLARESDKKPPYFLGAATFFLWPLHLLVVVLTGFWVFFHHLGSLEGIHVNEELSLARETARALQEEQARILYEIVSNNLDPADSLGLRALTESTIRQALAREEDARKLVTEPEILDSLLRSNQLAQSNAARHSEHLDLSMGEE